MYEVSGAFRRFCFDQAVISFGASLEAELDSVHGKDEKNNERKRQGILSRWLDKPMKYREPQGVTSSPTAGQIEMSGSGGEG
jgi:hypothetical protein